MAKIPVQGSTWLRIIQAAMVARRHWGVLTPVRRTDRARLRRSTRGCPRSVTAHETAELRRRVGKLDLPGLSKDLMPLVPRGRGRGRL